MRYFTVLIALCLSVVSFASETLFLDFLRNQENSGKLSEYNTYSVNNPAIDSTYTVTFNLNMANENVSAEGVFIAGGQEFGVPGDNPMLDEDGDGIFSATLTMNAGFFGNYTFTNGACFDWSCKENLAGLSCGDPSFYNDRFFWPPLYQHRTVSTCFGQCSIDGSCESTADVAVTFRVDMSEQVVAGGVFLHAAFDGWGSIEMSDIDGDNVYETTQNLTSGSYEFRYQNGEGMSEVFNAENFTECTLTSGDYTNRILFVGSEATQETAVYCYNLCTACGGAIHAGCMDPLACNYLDYATQEDDSCVYANAGADCDGNCLSDENYNGVCDFNELEQLEGSIASGDFCGEGTAWDFELEQCIALNLCQEDLDGDGVIGINDLLQLLSSFGTMCEGLETDEFTCGDPMNYHGYDYASVQIGEQCWFAENLRNEHYANGDAIPGDLSNSEWSNAGDTNLGAQAVYNNDTSNLSDYGRLYNWYAVDDARGLCPSGWHVATDGEFMTLEMELGMSESEVNSQGWRGTDQGTQTKSSPEDDPSWNGTNLSGLSCSPAGYRYALGGEFGLESAFRYWSSTLYGGRSWSRRLEYSEDRIYRIDGNHNAGMSVRCIKDTE